MNKEIQEFQESFFFGLSMRQCFFSVLAIAAAVGVYLGTKDTCGTEIAGWLSVLLQPLLRDVVFPLSPDDTGKVRMGVVKIRDFMPQKAGVSIGESLSEMSGRDNRNRNTFLQKWNGAGRTKEKQK